MRKYVAIVFGVLTLLSIAVWIGGAFPAAVLPWFGGVRADRIGQMGAAIFICGDAFVYVFGWLARHFLQERKLDTMELSAPRRYGNRKPR